MALDDQMNMFEETNDMGLMQEGGDIDPVSGNEIPLGGTQEGVRDDVEANVSQGEMVIPEDVVRYFGVEHFMRLRDEAKMGYKKMDAMGQMGNPDEASIPDDAMFNPGGMPFSVIDMEYVDEEEGVEEAARYGGMPAYHGGGYNPNASYQDNQLQTQMPSYQTGGVVPSTTFLANQPSSTISIDPATGQPVTTPSASPTVIPATLPQVSAAASTPSTLSLSSPVATPTISGAAAPPADPSPLPRIGTITGGAQSFKFFRNAAGATIQIPVINGRQVFEAPEGFTEFNPDDPFATPAVSDTADAATRGTTTTTRSLSDAEKESQVIDFGGPDDTDVGPDSDPEGPNADAPGRGGLIDAILGLVNPDTTETDPQSLPAESGKAAALSLSAQTEQNPAIDTFGSLGTPSGTTSGTTSGTAAVGTGSGVSPAAAGEPGAGTAGEVGQGSASAQATTSDAQTTAESLGLGDTGDVGGEGEGEKVICTALNSMYGFGIFRNAAWMKYNLIPKSYVKYPVTKILELGYHKIFGPLAEKMSYSPILTKVLRRIARVRTNRIRREMQGKPLTFESKVYTNILRPPLFIVGWLVSKKILSQYKIKNKSYI